MMKIAFAVAIAAAVLTSAPLLVGAIPAEAQTLRMAQGVDVQIGRDRDRPRRNDSDVTVGIGSGGVTVGPRQNCRMVTTTVERADGRFFLRGLVLSFFLCVLLFHSLVSLPSRLFEVGGFRIARFP